MRVTPFWPLLLVLACDSKTTPSKDAAPATGTPPPATVTVSAKPSASTAAAPTASAPPPLPSDAGAPCPVLSGPSQLPFTGPVALVARGDGVDLVFAADGGPKLLHSDLGAAPPPLPPWPQRKKSCLSRNNEADPILKSAGAWTSFHAPARFRHNRR